MSYSESSGRISEALIRSTARQGAAMRRAAPISSSTPFSIAISRETGSQGPAVARAVAKKLGWDVYDYELLELIARDLNVHAKLLESVDERHVNWLQETVESLCNATAVRENTYVRRLIETLLSLSARGNCVIVGRGSPFVLPDDSTLSVRLVAPLSDRVARISQERHLSRHDAEQFVERTDRERSQFVRLHFMYDPADVEFYDLVLNTANFPLEECSSLIIDALGQKQRRRAAASAERAS